MTHSLPTDQLSTADADRQRVRRLLVPTAVAAVVVSGALIVLRANSFAERAAMVPLTLVVAGVLFGVVVPRALRQDSAGGRSLGLGLAGLLLALPAFWSGVPLLLGTSAALLGYAGRRAATGSGKSASGMVLGLLAVLAVLAIYGLDWVANPGAGLL